MPRRGPMDRPPGRSLFNIESGGVMGTSKTKRAASAPSLEHAAQRRASGYVKHCGGCAEILHIDQFASDPSHALGLNRLCRPCQSDLDARRYVARKSSSPLGSIVSAPVVRPNVW